MNYVKYKGYDCIEFNIRATMHKRWVPYFLELLKKMQWMGSVGASRLVSFYSDGDGDFRPKFDFDKMLPQLTCENVPIYDKETHSYKYDAG